MRDWIILRGMDALLAVANTDTWKIAVVLGLLVLAVVLFASERLPVDVVTLLLLLTLIAFGILSVQQAFSGFSHEIIIILASIFVITGALQDTGVLDRMGAALLKFGGTRPNWLLFVLLCVTSGVSAFMNNTTVTAMLVGPVLVLAHKTRASPSKMLLPIAYASILGGTCTLIGTSTNVAVSGYMVRQKLEPLGLFEITPIGLVIVGVGIAYMMLVGRYLLPEHHDESLTEDYAIRDYVSEIVVMPGSPLIDQRVFQSDLSNMDFRILKVIRGRDTFAPTDDTTIQKGDVLIVTGNVENLMKVKATEGIEIKPDLKLSDPDLQSGDVKIAEVLVTPGSNLVGRTLREANYRQESGLTVLALYRRGRSLRDQLGSIRLRVGDLLLVQGRQARLDAVRRRRELAVLEELQAPVARRRKGLLVLSFFAAAILIGSLTNAGKPLVPLSLCFLSAALLTVLFQSINMQRAYQAIDWRLLILIGGMTAFGEAMKSSGTAQFLADVIVGWLQPIGPMAILAGFFVLTILLTQPMSNAAAALVVLPVAMEAAISLGVSQRTFAIAIMLAASISLIAPFEPSCLLVYGPGKYRFRDFIKTGMPLTIILAVIVLIFIPKLWPLRPEEMLPSP